MFNYQCSYVSNVTSKLSLKVSGEGGIRTHAPLRTNGFQDRLVMTTSIPLQVLILLSFFFVAYAVCVSARHIISFHSKYVNNFF